jgi:hypothetical protein
MHLTQRLLHYVILVFVESSIKAALFHTLTMAIKESSTNCNGRAVSERSDKGIGIAISLHVLSTSAILFSVLLYVNTAVALGRSLV